jgi:hypothetical protein
MDLWWATSQFELIGFRYASISDKQIGIIVQLMIDT